MAAKGLKQQWDLKDAQAAGAASDSGAAPNAQAKALKAAFNKPKAVIERSLQYTAANSEEGRHGALSGKQSALFARYQAALGKIDPSDEDAAADAIKKVLAEAEATGKEAARLKSETETAKTAWEGKADDKSAADGQIDELDQWGQKNAPKLLQVRQKIDGDAGARRWAAAVKTLEAMAAKLRPIYEELLRQKEAMEAYGPERQAFDEAFAEANNHPLPSIEMTAIADQISNQLPAIDGFAAEKNYVEALEQLRLLDDLLRQLQEARLRHEEREQEYNDRLSALQTDLSAASVSEFEVLTAMQDELLSVQTAMEESAAGGSYEQALTLLDDLEGKVRDVLTALEEEREKKRRRETFEARAADIEARMPTESRFASLADMESDLIAVMEQARDAAAADDFDGADGHLTDLEQKLEVYNTELERLKQRSDEYESRLEALLPRIQAASQCTYAQLEAMHQGVIDAQDLADQSRQAADAGDFDTALQQLGQAEGLVDAFEEAYAEAEQQRQDYQEGLAALQPDLVEASVSGAVTPAARFDTIQNDMATTQGEMEQAAADGLWDQALGLLQALKAKVEEYFKAIEAEQKRWQTARKGIAGKLTDVQSLDNAFDSLKTDKQAVEKAVADADTAAAAGDYEKAHKLLGEATTKADAYLKAAKTKQAEFDKKAKDIKKDLDDGKSAEEIVKGLSKDDIKHIPIATHNLLMEKLHDGGLSDDDKKAMHQLYSVKRLDPKFEKLDKKNRQEVIEAMRNDPAMKEARDNWGTWDDDKKKAALEKALDHYLDAFDMREEDGSRGVEIELFDKPPTEYDRPDGTKGKIIHNGSYSHSQGKIKINKNKEGSPKFQDFDRSMDVIVHETSHRYQAQLVEDFEAGNIPKTDPTYEQARAFAQNEKYYVSRKDVGDTYETQPQETHSREVGADIGDAEIGK